MKKLALAIGLGAYIAFGASAGSLAALRSDNGAGTAANRDSRIAWSVTGTNARLLFLNEALYPDTSTTATTVTSSPGAHGNQERADMAQPSTRSTDTQRLFCEGDICLVP
ncbi:MAG TPA: hypothetical protein VEN31_08920 [Candidatus Bathyarchaeia archaeon]|nr:hypothetical protein [Candidatus Bathyarchaeia archaeon]